jgi:hypothetical protein
MNNEQLTMNNWRQLIEQSKNLYPKEDQFPFELKEDLGGCNNPTGQNKTRIGKIRASIKRLKVKLLFS